MNHEQGDDYDQPPPQKKRRLFPPAFDAPSKPRVSAVVSTPCVRGDGAVTPLQPIDGQSSSRFGHVLFPKAFDQPASKSTGLRNGRISGGESVSTSTPVAAYKRVTVPPPLAFDEPASSSKLVNTRTVRITPIESAFPEASTSTSAAPLKSVKDGRGSLHTPLRRAFDESATSRPLAVLESSFVESSTPLRSLKPPSLRSLGPPPRLPDKGGPSTPLRVLKPLSFAAAESTALRKVNPPDDRHSTPLRLLQLPSFTDAGPRNSDTPLHTSKAQTSTEADHHNSETPLRTLKAPSFSAAHSETPLRPFKPPALAHAEPPPVDTTPLRILKPPVISRAEHPPLDTAPLTAHRPHLPPAKEQTPLRPLKPPSLSPRRAVWPPSPSRPDDASPSKLPLNPRSDSIFFPPHPSPLHPELARGLALSPQKFAWQERGQKYIRGGLAERAAHLLARAETGRSLWRTELSQRIKAAGGVPPRADMKLHIVAVRENVGKGTDKRKEERLLATCKADDDVGEGTVVFVFDQGERKDLDVRAGVDVLVWRPWGEVDVPERVRSGSEKVEVKTALLCTRFLVLPGGDCEREREREA